MADDEQFSLCWNNFNTNLSAGFHESLVRGDLVDVTLAAEGQLVKAHRLILSVCSPYFRKMFTQMPANQHAFIFLKDVSHSALKDLIQFMYCGEVNVKQDALPAFISTAEALQIKGLTETGESAPTQPSPAKETTSHLPPSASSTTIPSLASSPRTKPIVRSRNQSYKFDSDDGSDHEKVVQIQATSTPASVVSASSSTVTTQISVPQQVQILQQPTQQAQKRPLQQRASITPQTTQVLKRAKLTDPLEASEPAQIQTVQIVKQITQTPQPSVSSEPEYVEMPIETINPKAEPEYADDPSEVEAIDTEHEQEHSLAEQDTTEHDQAEDDSAHYVEDETYGDMSKYDETYFAEGEDAKAGASGFSESYAESGTGADQAAQAKIESLRLMIPILEAEQMTNAFRSPLTTPPLYACSSDYVHGNLLFPCVNLEHLENLESAVRESGTVREQYVNYLRASRYECQHEIERVLNRMFEDKAFMGYPYTTGSHANASIKSLGLNLASYEIFNSCMLDAWPDLNKNTLYEKISAFFGTTGTNGGMLEKKEMMNKTNSILEVEQCNEAVLDSTFTSPPFGYSSDYEYDCLVFPFNNSKQLALLEDNVKGSVDVREQYINYLRASRFECKNDLEKVLRRMFDEEAFMGYCYTWFPRPTSRPNLLSYCIFNDCMLDAWSDMTHDSLTDALSKLIPKMRKSAYRREYKALKSTHK